MDMGCYRLEESAANLFNTRGLLLLLNAEVTSLPSMHNGDVFKHEQLTITFHLVYLAYLLDYRRPPVLQ